VLVDNDKNIVPLYHSVNSAWAYSTSSNASTSYKLTTDSKGTVQILNLPILTTGQYYLKEVKAPKGYNLLKDYIPVDGMTYANPNVTTTVYDSEVLKLPMTGGMGYAFLIFNGVCLLGMAGVLIFFKRKKKI
jgi:LPXTG-motif cell wall-anchored protein